MVASPIWMQDTKWRETGRQVKVGPLDGRLMIFVVILPMFPSMYLLMLTIAAMLFFYALEYVGYTMPNALRKIHTVIAGKKRAAIHYWRQNKFRY